MLHFPVQPMKAVSGELLHDDDGWAYELKWTATARSPSSTATGPGCRARRSGTSAPSTPSWPVSPRARRIQSHRRR